MATFGSASGFAAPSSGAFSFGNPAGSGGFGSSVARTFTGNTRSPFGRSPVSWQDDASEPFGRVASTQQCFARNGQTSSASKWTPPLPPSRPLFQSTQPSSAALFGPSKSLFSAPQQTTSLFGGNGSSAPAFGCSQQTVSGGGFAFGATTKADTTSTTCFSSGAATSGGRVDTKPTNCFDNSSSSGFKPAFTFGAGTMFGSGSSSSTAKPPLAPSPKNPFTASTSNPFAKSTTQFGNATSNPFATKSARISTSSPFAPTPRCNGNPFAARVAPSSTVNPFAAPSMTPAATSTCKKSSFAAPGAAWSTGSSVQPSWKAGAGSAATKFKSGLRPAFKPSASPWSTALQQQTQPGWDWIASDRKLAAGTSGDPVKTPSDPAPAAESASEATSSSSPVASTTATSFPSEALVASPDENPYGSGSFGAGLLEQKVKTAVANPTSAIELKLLDSHRAPASAVPRQQPSARFASRLGLARQPRQALPVRRPVQPRFPNHRKPTAASRTRAKLPQADPFCFSSSFSRLAISKRALRIRVEPSSTSDSSAKTESVNEEPAHQPPEVSDDAPAPADDSADESEQRDNNEPPPLSACPVLLKDEYFTEPSVSALQKLSEEELARVENFSIGRRGCGKICFTDATDVRGLQLDELVSFSEGAVVVYPDDDAKPAVGSGLNKPAVVDLRGISSEENESHHEFLKRLESHTQALGATFLGYDAGVWSFRVEHF